MTRAGYGLTWPDRGIYGPGYRSNWGMAARSDM